MWTVTNVVEPIAKLAAEFALMSAVVTVDLQAIAQVVMQTATMVVVGPAVRTLCRGQCPGCSLQYPEGLVLQSSVCHGYRSWSLLVDSSKG